MPKTKSKGKPKFIPDPLFYFTKIHFIESKIIKEKFIEIKTTYAESLCFPLKICRDITEKDMYIHTDIFLSILKEEVPIITQLRDSHSEQIRELWESQSCEMTTLIQSIIK